MPAKNYLKFIKKREKAVSDIPRYFVDKLGKIQNALWRELQITIKGMDTKGANLEVSKMNLAIADRLRRQMRVWLRDNGYYEEITKFGAGYSELINSAKGYYKEIGFDPAFTSRDLDTLAKVRKRDLDFLTSRDQDVINTTYDEVINAIYAKSDWRKLSDRLQSLHTDTVFANGKELNGLLKKYARTYAFTAFAGFDRKVQNIKAAQYGLDHFFYSGSLIKDSRDFCSARVGRVFTRQEIEAWQSMSWKGKAAGRDIWTYLGGWNCRHILSPVTKEMAEDIKKN